MLAVNSFTRFNSFFGLNQTSSKPENKKIQNNYSFLNGLKQDTFSFSGELKVIHGGYDGNGSAYKKELARKIADNFNGLTPVTIKPFVKDDPSSETYVNLEPLTEEEKKLKPFEISPKLAGADLCIIGSTGGRPNDNIMSLVLATNAAKLSNVNKQMVVLPYCYYVRQDRQSKPGESRSLTVICDTLKSQGVKEIFVVEPHIDQFDSFFSIPVTKISTMKFLANEMKRTLKKSNEDINNVVIVSPDIGGAKRAEEFAKYLKADLPTACISKERKNEDGVSTSRSAKLYVDASDKDSVTGKVAIIVDDIIDSGGSIINTAKMLKANGASKVYVCAAHGIFSEKAYENFNNEAFIEKLIVTNTIPEKPNKPDKIEYADISGLIAETIKIKHPEYNQKTA